MRIGPEDGFVRVNEAGEYGKAGTRACEGISLRLDETLFDDSWGAGGVLRGWAG
jgi:hypothetical protein